jgi:uncharacterized protein
MDMPLTDAPARLDARFAAYAVTSVEELHAINGTPGQLLLDSITPYLTPLVARFIEASPYYLLATANEDGTCDVSPRGDPAGALHILDARTIVLPDRLGNKKMDSLRNIIGNPHVGLLFLIPGVDETVRVNGRALISKDPELLASLVMDGRTPKLAIVVETEQVFTHCARSYLRSGLWQPERWPDPDTIPTLAAMAAEQRQAPPPDESGGNKRNEEYRTRLY